MINLNRRTLLKTLGSGLLLQQLPGFFRLAEAATGSDYRALVCIFLYGGNDSNNTIIPNDSSGYGKYSAVRGDSTAGNGALGIPRSQLLGLAPATGSAAFGLHPDLSDLQGIWNAGQLGVVFNTGTLVQPLSKSQYLANAAPAPANLFSHADQQGQWQSAVSRGVSRSGWGGRISDALGRVNGNLPALLSLAGTAPFNAGETSSPLVLPVTGSFGLASFGGSAANSVAAAYNSLLTSSESQLLTVAAQGVTREAVAASAALNPILTGTSSVDALFSTTGNPLAQQLLRVAKLIANRSSLGSTRQVFFVSLGGFDTHTDQINRQSSLYKQLGPAMKSFNDAMQQLGTAAQVTSFTLSDFTRTLKPASGGGSDHAWGGHHFVMGGAVKGQQFYGAFPDLTLAGPDDVSDEGRWLPTSSVSQYGATLARWLGVSEGQLGTVFPGLANFSSSNLGFMNA